VVLSRGEGFGRGREKQGCHETKRDGRLGRWQGGARHVPGKLKQDSERGEIKRERGHRQDAGFTFIQSPPKRMGERGEG